MNHLGKYHYRTIFIFNKLLKPLHVTFSVLYVTFFFYTTHVNAQNLEVIGKQNPVKITGGLNLNTILYNAKGIEPRRTPLSYFATGNLNFDIYELVIPVSFTYSNQSSTFQQPFNQYSIHPKYKWAKADIGYISTTYSPYTLNGHIYNGVALELTPNGKFSYNVMYGRFLKAIEYDSLNVSAEDAAFKRMGCGTKIAYRNESDFAQMTMFYAKDDIKSIERSILPNDIKPEENLVLSAAIGKSFLKKMYFELEYATSALSSDISANEVSPENFTIYKGLGPLFTTRSSTSYQDAFKSSLSYRVTKYTLGIAYERIDPEYRTLGSYYFNNDLENITGNVTAVLFKSKVNVAINAGVQRDDLENQKISKMKRFVGAINLTYKPTEKLNLTSSYSNFQTFTNIRSQFVNINQLTPYDNLDTLNFTQLSQSASLNGNYLLPSKKDFRQSLNVNTSLQISEDTQGGVQQNSGSQFLAINTSYNFNITPKQFGAAVVFNLNRSEMASVVSTTMGPTLSVSKGLLEKKMKVSVSTSLNQTKSNGEKTGRFLNFRLASNYAVKKNQNLQASFTTLNRVSKSNTTEKRFTEYTGSISYTYSF